MDIIHTFGNYPMKEGGPVHMTIQMIYQLSSSSPAILQQDDENEIKIGGYILPTLYPNNDEHHDTSFHAGSNNELSTNPSNDSTIDRDHIMSASATVEATSAMLSSTERDKAIYYRGNILSACKAVNTGMLDRDDISFFIGASCWSIGQLEREIQNGFWIVCTGPTSIAQSGICDHEPISTTTTSLPSKQQRPVADLWLSMISACGEEEAKLAHLLYYDDDGKTIEGGEPCDSS